MSPGHVPVFPPILVLILWILAVAFTTAARFGVLLETGRGLSVATLARHSAREIPQRRLGGVPVRG